MSTVLKALTTTPQTSGTAGTTANTLFDSLLTGTSNTIVHNDAAKMGQAAGIRLTQGGTASNIAYRDLDSAVNIFCFSAPLKYGATPTVSVPLLRFYPTETTLHTTNLGTLQLLTTNRVQFVEGGTGTPLNVTSPAGTGVTIDPATDYYLDGVINCDTNALNIRAFARGATSPLWTLSGTLGADMAAAAGIRAVRWSIGAASASGINYLDTNSAFRLGSGTTSTDYLSRADVSAALTAAITVSPSSAQTGVSVSATVSASGGNGNAITYTTAWGDGQTTGPQASGSFSHTYTTAGTYTVTGTASQAA